MMVCIALSVAVFVAYVSMMAYRYGIADVVSEYAYRGGKLPFTLAMGASAMLMAPVMIDVAPEDCKFLGFLAAASLLIVAVAPMYKDDERQVHNTAAGAAGVCAVIWGLSVDWIGVTLWVIAYGLYWLFIRQKPWLIAEMCGMAMVYSVSLEKIGG